MKIFKPSAKQDKVIQNRKCYVNVDVEMPEFTIGKDTWHAIELGNGNWGQKLPIITTLKSNNNSKRFVSQWKLTPDPNNVDLKAARETAAELSETMVSEEKFQDGGRGFKNIIKLPNVGGDRYTIVCTKANQKNPREILECNIETWRGLWLTIFWTDNSHPDLINQIITMVRNEFKSVYIDFNHVPAEKKLDWDHDFASLISNAKDSKEDFVKAMHGGQMPNLKRKPFHFKVVMVKRCAKLDSISLKFKIDMKKADNTGLVEEAKVYKFVPSGDLTIKLPNSIQTLLDSSMVNQVAKLRPNYQFFNSIKSIKYKVNMTPQELEAINKKRTGKKPVDPAKLSGTITPTDKNVSYAAQWELTLNHGGVLNDFVVGFEEKVSIDFEIEIETANHSPAGQNYANNVLISTHGANSPQPADEIAKVLIHEIGHALGLVSPDLPDHYIGHGGVGSHCKFNAVLLNNIYEHGGGGKMCVMYHMVHAEAGPAFCKKCSEKLKMTKLSGYFLKSERGWT